MKGRQTRKGAKLTSETKKKISKTRNNIKYSDDTKYKMSKSKLGVKNPMSNLIYIFNNLDDLVFICDGNFNYVCEKNNLPLGPFRVSYQTNSKIVNPQTRYEIFRGWYAIKID
jgi:hypothetical protein